jgi:hypothetical protein
LTDEELANTATAAVAGWFVPDPCFADGQSIVAGDGMGPSPHVGMRHSPAFPFLFILELNPPLRADGRLQVM